MKRILLMLVMIAFACSGVEAQVCKTAVKHKVAVHKRIRKPIKRETVQSTACRMVPFQVCKISADRRSVSCYKTTDLANLSPMNSESTYFGGTATALPGEKEHLKMNTTVITNNSLKSGSCVRDGANQGTVCNYQSNGIDRDANGFYYYRNAPRSTTYEIIGNNMNTTPDDLNVISPRSFGGYMPDGQTESQFVPCGNSESKPQVIEWPIPCNYNGFYSSLGM